MHPIHSSLVVDMKNIGESDIMFLREGLMLNGMVFGYRTRHRADVAITGQEKSLVHINIYKTRKLFSEAKYSYIRALE